jgi:hypothetical protein
VLDKNLILPFIVEAPDGKENVSYSTELACAVCLTELQRRKTGFLRDTAEKVLFLSKIYYPIWAVPLNDSCLIIDGLASLSYNFTFKEPANTGLFIEDLKKNSVVNQEFMAALNKQAKNVEKFASTVNLSFKALIANREILNFFVEYIKSGASVSNDKVVLIPSEIDEKTAAQTREAVTNCLRGIHANVKGIQYALEVLNEEVKFHERMILNEVEVLKEKCETEVASLKPEVEKKVAKLKLKHDMTATRILKDLEKKAAVLEKKREKYMQKFHVLEQRKESTLKKRRTYQAYALEKYNREISNAKKEIRLLSAAIENVRKESDKSVKKVDEEFRGATALEEEKIKKIISSYETKIGEKNKQIPNIASDATSITKEFESLTAEMKREDSVFREQIAINWKLDDLTLICTPIYMAGYVKGNEERYSLFSPMTISEDVSVLQGLRKILALTSEPRLKLLMRPRSNELQEMLSSSVIKKMHDEETFRENINRICRANNLLEREDFEKTLNEGLTEAEKKRWVTAEEAMTVCSGIKGDET